MRCRLATMSASSVDWYSLAMEFFRRLFRGSNKPGVTGETFNVLSGSDRSVLPPADETVKRVQSFASAFVTASFLVEAPSSWTRDERLIASAYMWGVVDLLCQRAKLNDLDAITIHLLLCQEHLGVAPKEAGFLAALVHRGEKLTATKRGGQAVLDFLSQKDPNAPLALSELLHESRAEQK